MLLLSLGVLRCLWFHILLMDLALALTVSGRPKVHVMLKAAERAAQEGISSECIDLATIST